MAHESSPPRRSFPEASSVATSSVRSPDGAWLRRAYFLARLSRAWDTAFEAMARAGKIGRWYSAVGNEATTVGSALLLNPGDALVTVHRDLGAILATYLDVTRLAPELFPERERTAWDNRRNDPHQLLYRLACQVLGKRDGFTQGIDRSFHYGLIDPAQGIRHVGMISHLGAMLPVGAGLALASLQDRSEAIVLNFIGEGATSQGDFHETLNTAGVMKLPYVLVIENNQYAFTTPVCEQYACEALSLRAQGYGIAGETIDGTDLLAVHDALTRAFARARAGQGPTLIEAVLPRMRGHAEGDGSYELIPEELRKAYLAQDPLPKMENLLLARGEADPSWIEKVTTITQTLIEQTLTLALACPDPDEHEALRSMYAPRESYETRPTRIEVSAERNAPRESTYLDALRRAMLEEMTLDPTVFVMGQDIAQFGGAFRATRGLYETFGRLRVINTPLMESGAIGMALGAALAGKRPIVEIQFADFVSCGFNQIVNNLAKTYYRWRAPVPVVIRLPYGGGVGAGPFHSQSPEAWFTHVPGLIVVAPSTPADALGMLKSAIREPNPVIFLEHRFLYRREKASLPEGDHLVPLGKANVVRQGRIDGVTVLTWGWTLHEALAAADEVYNDGIHVEVVDVRSLVPLDEDTVFSSARKTGKILIVHEATLTSGFGAELAARIADACFEDLDGPIRRLAYPDRASPYNKRLEQSLLPDRSKIAAAIRKLARY